MKPGMAGREWGMGSGECPHTGCILSEVATLMYYQCKEKSTDSSFKNGISFTVLPNASTKLI